MSYNFLWYVMKNALKHGAKLANISCTNPPIPCFVTYNYTPGNGFTSILNCLNLRLSTIGPETDIRGQIHEKRVDRVKGGWGWLRLFVLIFQIKLT